MVNKNNTLDEMLVKILQDIEKLKEPKKENTEVFDGIIVAEEMNLNIAETLSDPVEVGVATVGTSIVGFCQVDS